MNVFVIARNKVTSYLFAKTLLAIADARAEGHRISMAKSDDHIELLDLVITGQSDNIQYLDMVIGDQLAELREYKALVITLNNELAEATYLLEGDDHPWAECDESDMECDGSDMEEYYESRKAALQPKCDGDLPVFPF